MVVPHTVTEEWIKSLKMQVRSGWRPWFGEGQLAGLVSQFVCNKNFSVKILISKLVVILVSNQGIRWITSMAIMS